MAEDQERVDGAVDEREAQAEMGELRHLLESIHESTGADFRDYAYSSLKRRVRHQLAEERIGAISDLEKLALKDRACMERLLLAFTIHVTAMFRDAGFFLMFRQRVAPILRTYPFVRLWVAGCSTGEEAYSLAILLHEEGLYPRCRIYATDVHEALLDKARAGIFPLSLMQEYTRNYQMAGGQRAFAEYYTADSQFVVLRPFLRENIVFATHNLVGDTSFNEFHVILCRNVLIYFNRALQDRVHRIFHQSLVTFGYLSLGRSETVRFSACEDHYEAISEKERIYRKIK